MRSLPVFFLCCMGLTGLSLPLHAEGAAPEAPASKASALVWLESWEKAAAASKESGKPILADFTGSDWCSWCKKLDKEVFATPEFQNWAQKSVVLLKLDIPRKTPQDPAIRKQNQELVKKYKIAGFPTILFLNAEGKELGQKRGYGDGSAKKWLESAQQILEKK